MLTRLFVILLSLFSVSADQTMIALKQRNTNVLVDAFHQVSNPNSPQYGKFTVRVYFPIDGICVTGSLDIMCNFALVRNAFNGNMSEKMLRMTYYDHELREVVEGSYIIISSLTCESCIGFNNKTLKEGILESAFIFGAVGMVAT